jgi:hypothetical protein
MSVLQHSHNVSDYFQFKFTLLSNALYSLVPGAPRNLAALATDKNITVMWDPPDNDSSYEYEITYGPVGGKSHKMGNIMGIRKVIMGLKPFTEYNFTIKVEVQDSPSSILLVWTLQSRKYRLIIHVCSAWLSCHGCIRSISC